MTTEEKIKQAAKEYADNQGGLLTEKTLNAFIAGANFGREIGMKTLSVKQPWAYLLCAGVKDIENRTWKLPEKYKGETILIHASARPNICILESSVAFSEGQWDYLKGFDMMLPFFQHKLATSAIIGSVRFVDCRISHQSIWAEQTDLYGLFDNTQIWDKNGFESYDGRGIKGVIYNWVATDAVLFEKPILNVKGKLRFWDYDLQDEYVELINEFDKQK